MKSFVCVLLLAAAVVAEPPRYERQSGPYPASGFRPSREFKLPTRQGLAPPSTSYGIPADSYAAPSNTYSAPQSEYGAPARVASSNANLAPQTEYGAPARVANSNTYSAPQSEYVVPARVASSNTYSAPQSEYGAPARVASSNTYSAPQSEYGAPARVASSNTNLAPQTEYGAPAKVANSNDTKDGADDGEGAKPDTKAEKSAKIQEEPKKDAEVISAQGAYYVLLPGSQLQRVRFQTENDIRNMAYTARLQYKSEDRAPIYVYTAVPQYTPSAAYIQLI